MFPCAAVGIGLLPFVLLELACLALGWGAPDLQVDPYVGFASQSPLFVKNDAGDRYEVARNRYLCFQPDSFDVRKSDDEFRVFCLGGSTVQGRPFSIETSFTSWLELSLRAAAPQRRWRVVNCGGVSYASYRLAPILQEILAGYEPDLIVIYTGHNEFLEDRTYQRAKHQPRWLQGAVEAAMSWRTFNTARAAVQRAATNKAARPHELLPAEVATRLDFEGGLADFVPDPLWRQEVVNHFRGNLARMVQLCREANAPCWLVDPVDNLRDCPPFKSDHRQDITDDELARWNALRSQATELYRTDMTGAIELLVQARDIDNEHAGLHYDLAKAYESTRQFDLASVSYLRAKDLDICPLRATTPILEAIRDVARRERLPLVPVREAFAERSRHGILGGQLLVDHVHPSLTGHQLAAEVLMAEFLRTGLLAPTDEHWRDRRDAAYQEHLEGLPASYFVKGQQRLENLRAWSQGRAPVWRKEPRGG